MRCGELEFRFIERSGLYFGLLLGFIQAALVLYYGSTHYGYSTHYTMAIPTMAIVLTMAIPTLTRSPTGGYLVLPQ